MLESQRDDQGSDDWIFILVFQQFIWSIPLTPELELQCLLSGDYRNSTITNRLPS